mgnify:CR=1 FL=1
MRPMHLALVLFIAVIWGVNFVMVMYVVAEFPPIFANAVRFIMVLAALSLYLRPKGAHMGRLIGVALVLGVLHFGLMFVAMSLTVDLAPIIVTAQTNVPFATLLAVLVFGERIGVWRTLGIALSFAGVLVIGLDPRGLANLPAVGLILASAFSYGLAANLMRGLGMVSPLTVQAWVAAMAVVGSLLISLVAETGQITALGSAGPWAWGGLVYGAFGAHIIGHVGMTFLFQRYEVTTVSPYMLLMPVFATAAAVLLADEVLSGREIAGGLMTISGVGLITLRNRIVHMRRRRRARPGLSPEAPSSQPRAAGSASPPP